MNITEKAYQDFRAHVLEAYPHEASGLIVKGRYIRSNYETANPGNQFQIDPVLLVKHEKHIQAVLHSHPHKLTDQLTYDPRWPSEADMQCWMQGRVPWGIVSTEGETVSDILWMDDSVIPPLLGREYVNGLADCYAVARDYYRLQGHDIPNLPRGMDWWEPKTNPVTGEVTPPRDILLENYKAFGFVEIKEKEARVGDAVLIRVRAQVVNHSGVITGEDELTHHVFRGLSRTDSLSHWKRFVVKYLRYQP
ncbi:NlpC/P60 family protein [Acidovorax sp.]|uniref:NlpC/P60 family protein n=1 Tax=Acidovorax sp. TaxID=1872122 RepID=UPI00391F6833